MQIPVATYRVQFNEDFTFQDAIELVPRLHRLGVTHLYCSPIWAARQGSTHGYDVVDPNRLNPVLGSEEQFDQLIRLLRERDMGAILDIVPNHMAASPENRWWMDVLESGSASPYAGHFGVNWGNVDEVDSDKIFLPILGDHYGNVLERGELQLSYGENGFVVSYYAHKLPVSPVSYLSILQQGCDELHDLPDFTLLLDMLRRLTPRTATDWEALTASDREKQEAKQRLWDLYQAEPRVREHLDRSVECYAGTAGSPESFDRLHDLLQEQAYRIAFWRTAMEKVNYRRFFDVTDLIGIRVENESVYRSTHALINRLVEDGSAAGLRVDHIDGLANPLEYLHRLPRDKAYVVVEKILVDTERLPDTWPVQGTTGYDFLGYQNSLFIEPGGLQEIQTGYVAQTGVSKSLKDIEYERKLLVMDTLFPGEVQSLGASLGALADNDRYARDLSPRELTEGLKQLTACMGVYRTYTQPDHLSNSDREYLGAACEEARIRAPHVTPLVFDFIRRVLQMHLRESTADKTKRRWLRFLTKWQQISGPIMAKGVEDSAFYVYNPLVSMNEVGGIAHAQSPAEMHEFLAERRQKWPNTMNASSTHDTKRSEDVRARINVLTELAPEWNRLASRWTRWMKEHRRSVDANEEYLLYQSLLGAWPLYPSEVPEFRERLKDYSTKAAREAREHTSWLAPSEEHESDLRSFIDALFENQRFLESFLPFQNKMAFYGAVNSLSQVLLKTTAPGLPDFYRGTIGWDFSLVDPDNRRPVETPDLTDFAAPAKTLLSTWQDGRVKVLLTEKALAFRKVNRELFQSGEYIPLEVSGKRRNHLFAFARRLEEQWVITAVPRFASQLSTVLRFPTGIAAWRDTGIVLPEGAPANWRNVVTGARLRLASSAVPAARLLESFPVALLVSR